MSFLLCTISWQALALLETRHREYPHTKEERLKIEVSLDFGEIQIRRSSNEKLAIIDYEESMELSEKLSISYTVNGTTGILRITLKDKMDIDIFGDDSKNKKNHRRLTLYVTGHLPVAMKIEVGAGKCDVDLSGLLVESLSLSAGAASVSVGSSLPNKITAEEIKFECGVGKFVGKQLANLNFQELRFEGGVGSYFLSFDGLLQQKGTVKMDVGVGSASVILPRGLPAKVYHDDNWLSSFRIDGNFEKSQKGIYETKNFNPSEPFLLFRLQSGVGSFSVKQQ